LFYLNHAFVSLLGYNDKNDILGGNLADILFKDADGRARFLKQLNKTGFVKDFELKFGRNDGIDVFLSVTANFSEDQSGRIIGIDGIVHDITDKSHLEEALLTEKTKLEQILAFDEEISSIKEFDQLINCVVDRVSTILEARKCSVMMLNDEKKVLMVVGAKGMSDVIAKNAKIELGLPIAGVVAGNGQPLLVKNIEYDKKFKRANKSTYLGRSFMIVPVRLGNKVAGVINVADKVFRKSLGKGSRLNYEETFNEIDLRILCDVAREVSIALENVELLSELNSLVVTDPLVNIYNYRQFSKSLDYEIKRCRRSDHPLCIIMIDIDDFKSYNDTFGHQEGDALLRNLGQIFKEQLREVDIVCRYAGDEFAVILPDTKIEGARNAAEKIRKAVADFSFKKEVTLSLGVAKYIDKYSQYDLILSADKALYNAKNAGKNRIHISQ
jgi:diguanylate cyclase (GGDEF)-like protein/PAS domain S-box-containing protein